MRIIILLTTCALFGLSALNINAKEAKKTPKPLNTATKQVKVAQQIIDVAIANTPEKRRVGLMWRKSMPANQGMLFIFDKDITTGFWMRNTLIDLDIAFIDQYDKIVGIDTMKKLTEISHKPGIPYRYALEVNAGFFAKHNVKVGDKVITIK